MAGAPNGSTDRTAELANGMDASTVLLNDKLKGVSADAQGNVYFSQGETSIWEAAVDGRLYKITGRDYAAWYGAERQVLNTKMKAIDVRYRDGLVYFNRYGFKG